MNRLAVHCRVCLSLVLISLFAVQGRVYAQEQGGAVSDPCAGPSSLLAILDRPTVSSSACAVQSGHVVLEMGFQRVYLRGPGSGTENNYPNAEVRIGLPGRNEFIFLPPNYNLQRSHVDPGSPDQKITGFSAVTFGLKHELGYTSSWLGAAEVLLTPPSGGSNFGSDGLGVTFNGIASYAPSEQIGLSLQLGVSSQTTPPVSGGGRFWSVVSNLVATWQPAERLQFYGEIFGQSSTGPGEGAVYNADGGVQFLITPSWEVDMEGGVRLAGNHGGFTHYFGAGTGFRF